jgi:hypothetical protein
MFESHGLYFVRVTAVEVPNHPKLYGDTKLRVDEVLIGPARLKGESATYRFFTPIGELHAVSGSRYAGRYPHFAYPVAKGQSRYWWATTDGKDGWKTANFQRLAQLLPAPCPELLLKADLKPDSQQAADQAELVKTLVRLEGKRTWIEQVAAVRDMQASRVKPVYLTGDRMLRFMSTRATGQAKE